MKPANLTRISTHSASHFVRGLGISSIPASRLYSTNLSYVTPGLLKSSSNVNDCFPPAPRFLDCSNAAATSGEDSFNRNFFNLANSFSIVSLLSSNTLKRSSSIKLHSFPMGVNRASALSLRKANLYSDLDVNILYGSRKSFVTKSSINVPR